MRILIVDDSLFARKRLRGILENAGHAVSEADGGLMALRLLAEGQPDLLSVDLLMPEMDGLELIGRVRASYPALPILVHTADMQQATAAIVMEVGASAIIGKNARPEEILAAVGRLAPSSALNFSETQHDAFMELLNIAMGQAADALGGLLERHVTLRVPRVQIVNAAELQGFLGREAPQIGALITQRFAGPLNGLAGLILPHAHATLLVRLLVAATRDLAQLSSAEQTVLAEVGNVILNATLARLGDEMHGRLQITLPSVTLNQSAPVVADLLFSAAVGARQAIVLLSRLTIGDAELVAYVVLMLPLADVRRLLTSLGVSGARSGG